MSNEKNVHLNQYMYQYCFCSSLVLPLGAHSTHDQCRKENYVINLDIFYKLHWSDVPLQGTWRASPLRVGEVGGAAALLGSGRRGEEAINTLEPVVCVAGRLGGVDIM